MSITDELREYAGKAVERSDYMGGLTFDLRRIADRIDAAMEDYIEPPKDADGQTIRIGDELVLQHEVMGKPCVVDSLEWDGEDWYFVCDEGLFNVAGWTHHHIQPDSWERIIEDAMGAYQFDDGSSEPSIGSLVERCKRLAGENA